MVTRWEGDIEPAGHQRQRRWPHQTRQARTRCRTGKRVTVDIGVDRQVKRARLEVGNKNRLLGSEVRNPQSVKEWFALPGFMLLALVIYGQRKRIAKAG